MTKRQKQIRAFLLSAALVMTQLSQPNLISHADQSIPEDGSIASFGTLESHVARQTVPPGTDQRELDLPRQLKARIYSVDVDSDRDQDGDSSWTEDSSIATGSEARRQNRKNSSVSVTSYWDQIPVIWDSDPVYDSDIEDVYVFTPQAEGYTLSRDAVLPSITVIVSGEASKSPPLSTRKKHSSCSLTNGCLLEEGHEGDCITEKHPNNSIPNNKTIASWTFLDDDFLNMGGLPLTGAGPDNPVDLNAIRSMLPTQLLAEIDGAGQPAAVAIEDWVCPEFIQDPEDNWPVSGSFLFEAVLEKGYLCEPLPSVKVILGGGNTLNGAGTGDFSVAGGISGTDYSYDDVGRILTILTGRELTISNLTPDTPTRDTIVVDVNSGVTANITLAGVNISVHNDSNACAFDMTGAAVNLTLQKNNVLKSGIHRAGLEAPEGSSLTITGSGSLEAVSRNEGAGIGGGPDNKGGNITINGGTIIAQSNGGAGIGGGFSSAGTGGSGGNIT
ncbi:MAG: hypothetical protein LIP16_10560, partial [Clostridium sp.]|nr:hypothetical protein [Clostridium sp.]